MIYSKTYVFDMGNIGQIDANESRGKTIKHCARRLVRAIAILKAAEPIRSDVFEVTVALLAQSLEQACLGIIYHFLGYSPNMHNLSHLLGICKIFWPENSSGFPVPTPYDKELLGILSKSHAEMRYTAGQSTETDDLDAAYSWCSNFVGAAEKVFLNSLSEMEKENYLSLS